MCLYVEKIPEDLKPLTAEKDIPVYKVLTHRKYHYKRLNLNRIFSPYMGTPIIFNFWGKCIMETNMDGKYRKEGINYANNLPKFIEYEVIWENGEIVYHKAALTFDKGGYLSINAGIHAYITREDARYQSNFSTTATAVIQEKLHKAVIPKGAHYFIGKGNEIVADKMIIYRKTIK